MAGDGSGIRLSERRVQDDQNGNIHNTAPNDASEENGQVQAGVERIEAVSRTWNTTSLAIAYVT
jgi:hypothetical protein